MRPNHNIAAIFSTLALFGITQIAWAGIETYANAPSPVRHAVHELASYTGIPIKRGQSQSIRLVINSRPNANLGDQGYSIRSSNDVITINANDDEGITNGTFTLLRNLMIEHRKDPFSREWNIEEKPHFTTRAMIVSPYRFGGSYGFAKLSSDRWSFGQWKEYVDLMRLTNMTTLTMGSMRMYHPDYPDSTREKWRYEVWKQVMDYCHQIGIKFNWFMPPNMVTEEAFWDNPDKRADQEAAYWYGNGLNWEKGKNVILENQRYTMEYFKELDALEIIYGDGGGFSLDDPNPAETFADATHSYRELLREVGNDADFVFWNWLLDFAVKVVLPKGHVEKNPKYLTMQDDILPLIPKDVVYLDASMLTVIQSLGRWIVERDTPPLRETVLLGKENNFKSVVNFFWYTNPETPFNMFPHPFIARTRQEAQYSRDELGVDGVMAYRLAPPMRFINDYVFFRLASDPDLNEKQLIGEIAGILAEKPETQQLLKEGVETLEKFWMTQANVYWKTHDLSLLEKAEELFKAAQASGSSKRVEYLSNGLTFLKYVFRMAESSPEEKDRLFVELRNEVKSMYIFQGLVADSPYLGDAVHYFRAHVEYMIAGYSYYIRNNPYSEIVDRSIYPKATSKPFKIQWGENVPGTPTAARLLPESDSTSGNLRATQ